MESEPLEGGEGRGQKRLEIVCGDKWGQTGGLRGQLLAIFCRDHKWEEDKLPQITRQGRNPKNPKNPKNWGTVLGRCEFFYYVFNGPFEEE
jgi:hypothetical protein